MPPVIVMCSLAVMCWQARQVTSGGNSPSGMSAQGPGAPHRAVAGPAGQEADLDRLVSDGVVGLPDPAA